MNFHWPFFIKPKSAEVAELRDRCIVAETRAILLENELERARRPKRERRRDAGAFRDAREATTQRYAERLSTLTPEQRKSAMLRAANRVKA